MRRANLKHEVSLRQLFHGSQIKKRAQDFSQAPSRSASNGFPVSRNFRSKALHHVERFFRALQLTLFRKGFIGRNQRTRTIVQQGACGIAHVLASKLIGVRCAK